MDTHDLHNDQPVSREEEDSFQRYDFAVRIAKTIKDYRNLNSLVAAVYAKWGEGKTSVLNFIKSELERDEKVIVIDFNPWMYSGDEQLLLSFFQVLSGALKKPLKGPGEKVGNALRDYAGTLGLLGSLAGLPNAKEAFKAVGDKLSSKSLSDYRKVVDDALEQSGQKVVVFVDDIDRLTIGEVQAVFKLIKLVADFNNTVYFLSFDDEMVASSLDPVFAAGGQDYLEKIVQLPLRLPKAQTSALRDFTYNCLDRALKGLDLELSEEEVGRFTGIFQEEFLEFVDNPRFAIRYANSIYFTLPLLKGEVNTVDLMLMEAIKVVFPDLYSFIKEKSDLFTRNFGLDYSDYNNRQDSKDQVKNGIDQYLERYSKEKSTKILKLLRKLFPTLDSVYGNIVQHKGWQKWYTEKRVCSARYIDRYFSYVVIKGEVSDVFFDDLVSKLSTLDFRDRPEDLYTLMEGVDMDELILKFSFLKNSFDPDKMKGLAKGICLLGDYFKGRKSFMRFGDTFWQAGLFVKDCIIGQEDKRTQIALAQDILSIATPTSFAAEVFSALRGSRESEYSDTMHFKEEEVKLFSVVYYSRIRGGGASLGDLLVSMDGRDFRDLLTVGATIEPRKIKLQTHKLVKENKDNFLKFLYAFSPTIQSSSEVNPYNGLVNQSFYDALKAVINIDFLYQRSVKLFGDNRDEKMPGYMDKASDKQLVGSFQKVYWQNQSGKNSHEVN
ncbi:KAP family P-loop NTPase fold protein [Roseivirga pacifica]|uniref:KAP family P-loop NTPase fold protein n=1 Tax=Roseivirga pacifica TaxID=1267423 RepID=UPI003BA8962E